MYIKIGGNILNQLILVGDRRPTNVQKTIIYFFIYSFIGWIIEVIYAMFVQGEFVNRGFLFGPICPIYGFGAIILIVGLRKVKGNKIMEFLIATIAFTIFEYLVSYVLEILFQQRWWDYSQDILNLQGRISILYSIVWGILGVLFIEKLHPFIRDKVNRVSLFIPKMVQRILEVGLLIAIFMDTVLSIVEYLGV